MRDWFPTFRRLFGIITPLPAARPWRTTWPQQQSLLRLIMVAVEENLPLGPVVACWAADESGIQRRRLERLAELLEGGTPLPEAVEEVRGVLSDEDILAIRFGAQSGTLVASIRDRLDEQGSLSSNASPRWRQFMDYLIVLLVVGCFIVTFLQIKIVPELVKIFDEFELSTPTVLSWSISFAYFFVQYWYLVALAVIATCWFVFSSWPGRRLRSEVLGRLVRPLGELHTADALEKLSVALQAGRPMAGALSTLARYHFDPMLRHRLLFIRNELEQGADVWQSMQSVGLLSEPEARVLETANRVGNRPWALKQIAQVKRKRTTHRLAQLSELALPAVILPLGGFVLFQALAVFVPLVHIVQSLL